MMSAERKLPFILEDRTGLVAASDFDDIYDRLFLRIAEEPLPQRPAASPSSLPSSSPLSAAAPGDPAAPRTLMIFDMAQRWSPRREYSHYHREPVALLHFGAHGALGAVVFATRALQCTVPMAKYLAKTSLFASSLSRQFTASDGQRYRWSYRSMDPHEWVCLNADTGAVIAAYDLRAPSPTPVAPAEKSGNVLTLAHDYAPLAVELLCSLTIMRHIQQHHL